MSKNNQKAKEAEQRLASATAYCYAVETLEIELNRIKALLRVIDENSYRMMSNIPGEEKVLKNKESIEKAIQKLKEA